MVGIAIAGVSCRRSGCNNETIIKTSNSSEATPSTPALKRFGWAAGVAGAFQGARKEPQEKATLARRRRERGSSGLAGGQEAQA